MEFNELNELIESQSMKNEDSYEFKKEIMEENSSSDQIIEKNVRYFEFEIKQI